MLVGQSSTDTFNDSEGKEDLDILDGDIQKSIVNGVPSISFSDKIHKILIQVPLHMMDIENGYFPVKFQNKLDCERALSEGPWIIFGQYL
ncbi:hypothetical protein Golob_027713, partial [Gossypium lobatum]|nr:hypothetical protein [Gossypium lobatum]